MIETIIITVTFGLPFAALALAVSNTFTALQLTRDLEDRK